MHGKEEIDPFDLIKPPQVELSDKEVDILIALSDNKGYVASELAKIIGSFDSYLSNLLNNLASFKYGNVLDSVMIFPEHIKDPISLVYKIRTRKDPLSKYIFEKCWEKFEEEFNDPDIQIVSQALSFAFTNLLSDESIYTRDRFAHVKLSEDAKKLIRIKDDLINQGYQQILNRILIENAYPDEICENRFPLIKKISRRKSDKTEYPYLINPTLRVFDFIIEYFIYLILQDQFQIKLMTLKQDRRMRIFGDHYIYRETAFPFEEFKTILNFDEKEKIGKFSLSYYKDRYEKNIKKFSDFMMSDYVGAIMNKYGASGVLWFYRFLEDDFDLPFDSSNFLRHSLEKKYISQEELLYIADGNIHQRILEMSGLDPAKLKEFFPQDEDDDQ